MAIERLSSVTGDDIGAYFTGNITWTTLTDAQKLAIINAAQTEIAAVCNSEGLDSYLTTEDIAAEGLPQ